MLPGHHTRFVAIPFAHRLSLYSVLSYRLHVLRRRLADAPNQGALPASESAVSGMVSLFAAFLVQETGFLWSPIAESSRSHYEASLTVSGLALVPVPWVSPLCVYTSIRTFAAGRLPQMRVWGEMAAETPFLDSGASPFHWVRDVLSSWWDASLACHVYSYSVVHENRCLSTFSGDAYLVAWTSSLSPFQPFLSRVGPATWFTSASC